MYKTTAEILILETCRRSYTATGWNLILTSATSFRSCFIMRIICSSSTDVSCTVRVSGTSATRSTYINDPARRARRLVTPMSGEGVDVADGGAEERMGSSRRFSDWRVFGETPASVRSPQAPASKLTPCCRMTIETRRPRCRVALASPKTVREEQT